MIPQEGTGSWRQWLVTDIWDDSRAVIGYPERLVDVVVANTGKNGTRKTRTTTRAGRR